MYGLHFDLGYKSFKRYPIIKLTIAVTIICVKLSTTEYINYYLSLPAFSAISIKGCNALIISLEFLGFDRSC